MYLPDIFKHLWPDQVDANVVHVLPLVIASVMAVVVLIKKGQKYEVGDEDVNTNSLYHLSPLPAFLMKIDMAMRKGPRIRIRGRIKGSGSRIKDYNQRSGPGSDSGLG